MIKLPERMAAIYREVESLHIPPPTIDAGVRMSDPPQKIADRLGVVGGYLSYLEYTIGAHEVARILHTDEVDTEIALRMAGMDPKATIKSKESEIIAGDPTLQHYISERTRYNALIEHLKGYRNGYRAQYDALSRMLSAKQLEAEVSR